MKMTNGFCAAFLALAATSAQAEQHGSSGIPSQDGMQMERMSQDRPSGMMSRSGMGGSMMPGMMIAMMDTNEDGALSLEEVQTVHERMFNMADADGNGLLILEEIRGFMAGGGMMDQASQ